MAIWYKDAYYWRRTDGDRDGTGDLIFNTCTKIIQDRDRSDWAIWSLLDCERLLKDRKRWPDRLNTGKEIRTLVGHYVYRILRRLKLTKAKRYGYQKRMSRDPFIAWFALCEYLNVPEKILEVPIPWYLYRPSVWQWRRRLITGGHPKRYVRRLRYLRSLAVVWHYERRDGDLWIN